MLVQARWAPAAVLGPAQPAEQTWYRTDPILAGDMARVVAAVLMAFALLQAGALGPAADSGADSEADRPKGARRRARERALVAQSAEEVAKSGCVNLGGGKWFSEEHGGVFSVDQHHCRIFFELPGKAAVGAGSLKYRGIVRGYAVHVEPPFPDGQMLPNQTVVFDKPGVCIVRPCIAAGSGARWER